MSRAVQPSKVAMDRAYAFFQERGQVVTAVDIRRDGSFRLLTVVNQDASADADLDGELEAWRKANGDG